MSNKIFRPTPQYNPLAIPKTDDQKLSPGYYSRFKFQPAEFILANDLSFPVGSIIKYVCRFDMKNGIEDLKKARTYIDLLIERELEKLRQQDTQTEESLGRGPYNGKGNPSDV